MENARPVLTSAKSHESFSVAACLCSHECVNYRALDVSAVLRTCLCGDCHAKETRHVRATTSLDQDVLCKLHALKLPLVP